jgi:hypothetical protein
MAKKITSSTGGLKTDALPESPRMQRAVGPEPEPSGLTVGGIPVEHILGAHRIPYANTDQGIAERLAKPHALTTSGADELDKTIQHRRDFRENETDAWLAPDPMKDLADKHVKQGFSGKFMNRNKVNRDGARGFERILDDKGHEVTLGNMYLAQAPIDFVKARNKRYQKVSQQQMAEVTNRGSEEQARFARDAGVRSRTARAPDADEGLHEVRGNSERILR